MPKFWIDKDEVYPIYSIKSKGKKQYRKYITNQELALVKRAEKLFWQAQNLLRKIEEDPKS